SAQHGDRCRVGGEGGVDLLAAAADREDLRSGARIAQPVPSRFFHGVVASTMITVKNPAPIADIKPTPSSSIAARLSSPERCLSQPMPAASSAAAATPNPQPITSQGRRNASPTRATGTFALK